MCSVAGAWHSAPVCPCVPAPWSLTWDLRGRGGVSWSGGRRAEVRAEAVSAGRGWNAGAAVKAVGAIALGPGSVLGFPGRLPSPGRVSELLPGLGLGACGVVGSSS